ncbi:4-hydroxyphenylpyruvate dioxygenase [Streptomyces lavendulae]|uniref:4-hydroxyphenylpyruvate dioxygenase n=1 Tax=Streptomyces lavendulae TaxID=1914 RepID=UPI0037F59B20
MIVKGLDHLHLHAEDCFAHAAHLSGAYGFTLTARTAPGARDEAALLTQGRIRLLISSAPAGRARDFVDRHGDGVADIALAVDDAVDAYRTLTERGAEPVSGPVRLPGGTVARVRAFGDVIHSLIERDDPAGPLPPTEHDLRPTGDTGPAHPLLHTVDHLAVCLPHGDLHMTADRYRRTLGLDVAYEEYTAVGGQAMDSKVVQDPQGHLVLTLIEPDPRRDKGQIDRFLEAHAGAGVQHIAFRTDDIAGATDRLRARGVDFLTTPDTYYDTLEQRVGTLLPPLDTEALRSRAVLADQDRWGRLFQIFSRSTHPRRTLFFELIQRDRARTFGSGNIRALYEAVRRTESTLPATTGGA